MTINMTCIYSPSVIKDNKSEPVAVHNMTELSKICECIRRINNVLNIDKFSDQVECEKNVYIWKIILHEYIKITIDEEKKVSIYINRSNVCQDFINELFKTKFYELFYDVKQLELSIRTLTTINKEFTVPKMYTNDSANNGSLLATQKDKLLYEVKLENQSKREKITIDLSVQFYYENVTSNECVKEHGDHNQERSAENLINLEEEKEIQKQLTVMIDINKEQVDLIMNLLNIVTEGKVSKIILVAKGMSFFTDVNDHKAIQIIKLLNSPYKLLKLIIGFLLGEEITKKIYDKKEEIKNKIKDKLMEFVLIILQKSYVEVDDFMKLIESVKPFLSKGTEKLIAYMQQIIKQSNITNNIKLCFGENLRNFIPFLGKNKPPSIDPIVSLNLGINMDLLCFQYVKKGWFTSNEEKVYTQILFQSVSRNIEVHKDAHTYIHVAGLLMNYFMNVTGNDEKDCKDFKIMCKQVAKRIKLSQVNIYRMQLLSYFVKYFLYSYDNDIRGEVDGDKVFASLLDMPQEFYDNYDIQEIIKSMHNSGVFGREMLSELLHGCKSFYRSFNISRDKNIRRRYRYIIPDSYWDSVPYYPLVLDEPSTSEVVSKTSECILSLLQSAIGEAGPMFLPNESQRSVIMGDEGTFRIGCVYKFDKCLVKTVSQQRCLNNIQKNDCLSGCDTLYQFTKFDKISRKGVNVTGELQEIRGIVGVGSVDSVVLPDKDIILLQLMMDNTNKEPIYCEKFRNSMLNCITQGEFNQVCKSGKFIIGDIVKNSATSLSDIEPCVGLEIAYNSVDFEAKLMVKQGSTGNTISACYLSENMKANIVLQLCTNNLLLASQIETKYLKIYAQSKVNQSSSRTLVKAEYEEGNTNCVLNFANVINATGNKTVVEATCTRNGAILNAKYCRQKNGANSKNEVQVLYKGNDGNKAALVFSSNSKEETKNLKLGIETQNAKYVAEYNSIGDDYEMNINHNGQNILSKQRNNTNNSEIVPYSSENAYYRINNRSSAANSITNTNFNDMIWYVAKIIVGIVLVVVFIQMILIMIQYKILEFIENKL